MNKKEENIMVSIICNTYNHAPYIRDCLDGFMMQKTDFSFEVLIHDDASTDGTQDIIREYEEKYPDIIKPIYQSENKYSKHILISMTYQYPRVKGKYTALCEGDDYWTDPLKLQKQFDAMEQNPKVDICAHGTKIVNAKSGKLLRMAAPKNERCIIPFNEVIAGDGRYVATSSLFYRSDIDKDIPHFRSCMPFDYTLQMHGSLRGGMLYLNDCMSVYRFLSAGSWTANNRRNIDRAINHLTQKIKMMNVLNDYTNKKYDDIIKNVNLYCEFYILTNKDLCKEALTDKFSSIHKEIGKKPLLKLKLKAYCPFLLKIKALIQFIKK